MQSGDDPHSLGFLNWDSLGYCSKCENCGDCEQRRQLNELNKILYWLNKEIKRYNNLLIESPNDNIIKIDLFDVCIIKKDILKELEYWDY